MGWRRRVRVFLGASSPALWAVLTCKLLEACSYMMCAMTLRQYLQDNFAFSDIRAGLAYGCWGLLTTVYGVLLGPVIDKVGVRHSLLSGAVIMGVSRFWLALTLSEFFMLANLFFLLPIGLALGQPVKMIGVRRYTVAITGTLAWSLVFLAMNVGFAFSGIAVDVFREQFEKKVRFHANISNTGRHRFTIVPGPNGSSVVILPFVDNSTGTAVAKVVWDQSGGQWVQSNIPHQGLSVWDQMTSYRWIQFASGVLTCVMFLIALLFVTNEEVVWVKGTRREKIGKDMEGDKAEEDVRRGSQEVRGIDIMTLEDLDELQIEKDRSEKSEQGHKKLWLDTSQCARTATSQKHLFAR